MHSPGQADRKANVKKVRLFPKLVPRQEILRETPPELFVFCDRSNRNTQFRVERYGDLDCTLERLAGTLAVQCLVSGQTPEDFAVFVPAEKALVEQLMSRASKLLIEGRANSYSVSLSLRQKEILQLIVGNRANKEIASKLNISVRTVKFHVSALLKKFGVENRNELARKAAGLMAAPVHEAVASAHGIPSPDESQKVVRPVAVGERLYAPDRRRSIRFPGRMFSA